MNIHIDSVADIGKTFNIKREKIADETKRVIGHLKFANLLVPRESLDEFMGQPSGWAQRSLYDPLGAPIAQMEVSLPLFNACVTGVIRGVTEREVIKLTQAILSGVSYIVTNLGAKINGELTWEAAGDEVSDLEPLLDKKCAVVWVVQDAGQADLLRAA